MGTRLSTVLRGSPTPLELLIRDFLNSCRARGLSVKTVDQTYKPRLERQFLSWANAEGINEVEQVNQRAIERYQAHLFGSGLRKEKRIACDVVAQDDRRICGAVLQVCQKRRIDRAGSVVTVRRIGGQKMGSAADRLENPRVVAIGYDVAARVRDGVCN